MAIKKGHEWGEPGELPGDAPTAADDVDLARLVADGHRVLGLRGGDLAKTLGISESKPRTPRHRVGIDLIEIESSELGAHVGVAHVVAGRIIGGRRHVALMNAAWIGHYNVAPRAHPGDGRAEVLESTLVGSDRIRALRRARTGTHLPHPDIAVARSSAGEVRFDRAVPLRVDGRAVGRTRQFVWRLLAEAVTVVY